MPRSKAYTKQILKVIEAAIAAVVLYALLLVGFTLRASMIELKLVSVRDNIPGSFTTTQSLYADDNRIYLASHQGTLFVLARDRNNNFPLLESINLKSPLTAVIGAESKLFVASATGSIYIFELPNSTTSKLNKVETKLVSTNGVGSLAVASDGTVVAGLGQGRVAVSGDLVFVSGLNPGDDALVLGQNRRLVSKADTKATDVYRLSTGEYQGTISNFGASAVSLASTSNKLFMTSPGCCGTGFAIYDVEVLDSFGEISVRYTNSVVQKNDYLIAGGEDGKISLISGSEVIGSLELRKVTKQQGREDIEIRSLWADSYDNLIFAASSWGNDASRSNDLPSFFVLEIDEIVASGQRSEVSDKSQSISLPALGEGQGEAGNTASGFSLNIPTAQASEIDKTQIKSTTNIDSTSSPTEIDQEGKSIYDYITKFFLTISNAFKFLIGMIA